MIVKHCLECGKVHRCSSFFCITCLTALERERQAEVDAHRAAETAATQNMIADMERDGLL